MGISTTGLAGQRQHLLDDAATMAGAGDFGDNAFVEGLDRFLASVDAEDRLSAMGRAATEAQVGLLLRTRLHAQAGFAARPDALARTIERPLIITGIVRSGTTALHRLLSIDPQFQCSEHWLTRAPMPRPPRSQWAANPHYCDATATLDGMIAAAPEMLNDHMMSADAVEESIFLLAPTFCNNMFPSQWHVPDYDAWYRETDETPSYRWLADVLKLIGADTPDRRWLMKNPTDLHAIDAVLAVFPDALIVQTHRDPVQAIPSIANLLLAVRRLFEGDRADGHAVIEREAGFWADAIARTEAAKLREPGRFIDIEFGAFVKDQMGAVQSIYDGFGLILAPEVEANMRAWLDAHPRRSGAIKRHAAEDFGLGEGALANLYADYRQSRGYA